LQGMQICLCAGVGEAHEVQVEALAEETGVAGFVFSCAAEV
jgi:hypothetical protein